MHASQMKEWMNTFYFQWISISILRFPSFLLWVFILFIFIYIYFIYYSFYFFILWVFILLWFFILYFLVFYYEFFILVGLSWCFSGKEMACQCRRHRFNPLVRNITEEGNINPLQCSCLGNPMDRRSLADYNSWGPQRVGHNLATKQQLY